MEPRPEAMTPRRNFFTLFSSFASHVIYPALALSHFTDKIALFARSRQVSHYSFRLPGRNDHCQAYAHVEGAQHLGLRNPAGLSDQFKHRGHRPLSQEDVNRRTGREDAGNVFGQAAPGDVGQPLYGKVVQKRQDGLYVNPGGLQQFFPYGAPQPLNICIHPVTGHFQQHLAGKGIAVAVQAGRGKADHPVARNDAAAVNNPAALHHSHGKPGQVVLLRAVEARHLRRFAADQGAAGPAAAFRHTAYNCRHLLRNHPAYRQVVQEEQRLGPVHENIVYAHGHGVDANGVMPVHQHGHPQLGAHPIGAGHQHRLFIPGRIKRKQPAKAPYIGQDLRPEGAPHGVPDQAHRLVSGFNVHPCVSIGKSFIPPGHKTPPHSSTYLPASYGLGMATG
ncbi:hypothetical protein PTH_2542 [Pelotomaculum thermopropionicum SI]|uniref:Uncharacterized protein n=1 Tax=Pelotomaculum thermopropionicum (strain DSM 13744 / JCM 10971 / SI) TaxID=370438 RepID=A5CZ49_PELTS|nr:hypothetical protein PTH_2542 [Pelotomaculum thermopropionicum SI]